MLVHLADFLEREAGHVIVALLVLVLATVAWSHHMPGAEAVAGAAHGLAPRARSLTRTRKARDLDYCDWI